jgi:type 1 fimbria pilin
MVFSGMVLTPFMSLAQMPQGTVSLDGAIIEAPCAIEAGSRDQSISITTVPVSQIIHDRESPESHFSIRLINCVLTPLTPGQPDWQSFRITFDGPTDGQNFETFGHSNGLAMKITDSDGNAAIPGQAMASRPLSSGGMTLNYVVRVVSNNKHLKAGNFQATVRYKLDYY